MGHRVRFSRVLTTYRRYVKLSFIVIPDNALKFKACPPVERIFGISNPEYRINRQIRAREVRLIDDSNDNIGVVPLYRALEMAEERQLDLVEVAPNADPPVCRIMDFGKFQYEKQRRERKARKTQKVVEVKQIRLGPTTDEFHMNIMVRNARRWLEEGMKVRFSIKFRGRQNLHTDIGRTRLSKIAEELGDVASVEQMPNLEGNTMYMMLTPGGDASKKQQSE